MHEEVFRFDRIVGEVRGDSVIVLRMNRVIDGVFFEHGRGSPVGGLGWSGEVVLVGLSPGADPLEALAAGDCDATVARWAGGVGTVFWIALIGDERVGDGLPRRSGLGGTFGRGGCGSRFFGWAFHDLGAGRGSEVKLTVDSTGSPGEGPARASVEVGAFIVVWVGPALVGGVVLSGVRRAAGVPVPYSIG
jgi:hypothetical protein